MITFVPEMIKKPHNSFEKATRLLLCLALLCCSLLSFEVYSFQEETQPSFVESVFFMADEDPISGPARQLEIVRDSHFQKRNHIREWACTPSWLTLKTKPNRKKNLVTSSGYTFFSPAHYTILFCTFRI